MPIADVEHNPWEAAAPAAAPTGQIADVEHNPWATPSVPMDVAKSAGVGLGEGAIGMLGSVGDIRSALSSGVDYLGGKLGISPETVQAGKQAFASALPGGQAIAAAPTSQQIQSGVEGITGPFYQPQTVPGEYARTVGQFAPAAVAGPGGIVRRAVTQAVIPALASETGGQVFKGTELEPYARLAGGVGGALAAPAATGALRSIVPSIGPERAAAISTLANEGVQVPAGMATGSKVLKAAESELGGAPIVDRMNEQYTAAALRKAGINAPRATPDVLNNAAAEIGAKFEDVAARNPNIPIKGFLPVADAIIGDFRNLTGAESPLLNDLRGKIGADISGRSYQTIQSEIQRYARATSSPELRSALYDMKGALDKAIESGLPNAADAQQWSQARGQWKNLMTVDKAVSGSTESAAAGLITPAKLTQAIESMKRGSYVRGRGDFAELARAGNQVMKPFQDSGTATRTMVRAVPAVVAGMLGGGIHPAGLAAATVGPYFAGKALMSPAVQRLLTNQALATRTPAARAAAGALLPIGAATNQLYRRGQP